MDRLQSARGEVEDFVAKAREARREETLEAERVARQIEEASGAKLQSLLSRLDQELEQKFGAASGRLAAEAEQRLQAQVASIVESTSRELASAFHLWRGRTLPRRSASFKLSASMPQKKPGSNLVN